MELFVQKFVADSIDATDVSAILSRRDLNRLLSAGNTRKEIKRNLFFQKVRTAIELPNFDRLSGGWSNEATELAANDYLVRLAPFILPELAHQGIAFLVDPDLVGQCRGREPSPPDKAIAEEALCRRASAYIEFQHGSVYCGDLHLRAVVTTHISRSRSKWSAAFERADDPTALVALTWYVVKGEASSFENVIHSSPGLLREEECDELCVRLTNLVQACMAACATNPTSAARRSSRPPAAPSQSELTDAGSETEGEAVHVPGCQFRVCRLAAPVHTSSAGEHPSTGKKLKRHIMVAGHYKSVACGKGRMERRRVWIPDYHKGPAHLPLETTVPLFKITPATEANEEEQ